MPLVSLDDMCRIQVERGETAVVIPLHGAHEMFVQCINAVLQHTPATVPVVVLDDHGPDDRSAALLRQLDERDALEHTLYYRRHEQNRGFVHTTNEAFELCAPADVIVLNSDCVVTPGWFEAMTSAGRHPLVATVSVFTNHGTIVSLPERNRPQPLPQTLDPAAAAEQIRKSSLHLRPRLPTAIGHCFLVKRAAIELVGPLDVAFSPGYGEEVDFSQRCVQHGLLHVLADDAFVLHHGSASFAGNGANPLQEQHHRMISIRYGYYDPWVDVTARSENSPLADAIGSAQRALREISVTVDARCLGPIVTGTQLHTLEVITALAHHAHVAIRAVVPADMGSYAREALSGLPVELVSASSVSGQTDVVHRPLQVSSYEDLEFLEKLGKRVLLTQQDLISYHNPAYYRSFDDWSEHRMLTRRALAFADRVIFFSHSAAAEAINEQLISPDRAEVVYLGTDHRFGADQIAEQMPIGVDRLLGRPFLVCLGTDYLHKNREFALRVFEALRRVHGWDGGLILAGPHVPVGSSAALEAEYLASHPELSEHVVDVAAVSEAGKRWLLANAAAMIYPSVHEGFGLVPFEAAEAGLPCAFAAHTSLAELLPSWLGLIEPWDAEETAERLFSLVSDPDRRRDHVAAVRQAGARYTWRKTAIGLLDVYRSALASPPTELRRLVQHVSSELETAYGRLHAAYSEFPPDARGLVGRGGVIPEDVWRPLLALGARPVLSKPLWGLLRAGYRAGRYIGH
jgi:glycosyltransferase involved in cell wall biosynthesis/GT2 family glycosyltransferase